MKADQITVTKLKRKLLVPRFVCCHVDSELFSEKCTCHLPNQIPVL